MAKDEKALSRNVYGRRRFENAAFSTPWLSKPQKLKGFQFGVLWLFAFAPVREQQRGPPACGPRALPAYKTPLRCVRSFE